MNAGPAVARTPGDPEMAEAVRVKTFVTPNLDIFGRRVVKRVDVFV